MKKLIVIPAVLFSLFCGVSSLGALPLYAGLDFRMMALFPSEAYAQKFGLTAGLDFELIRFDFWNTNVSLRASAGTGILWDASGFARWIVWEWFEKDNFSNVNPISTPGTDGTLGLLFGGPLAVPLKGGIRAVLDITESWEISLGATLTAYCNFYSFQSLSLIFALDGVLGTRIWFSDTFGLNLDLSFGTYGLSDGWPGPGLALQGVWEI